MNPNCCSFFFKLSCFNVIDNEEVKEAKALEQQGVLYAESGELELALEMFNKAVSTSTSWASSYNNRAQALRLLRRDKGNLIVYH